MSTQVQAGLKQLIEDLVKAREKAFDDESSCQTSEAKNKFRWRASALDMAREMAQKLYNTCFTPQPEKPKGEQMTQEEHGKWCESLKPGDIVIVRHKDWNKEGKECWYESKVLFTNDQVIGIHNYVMPRKNGMVTVGLEGQTSQVAIFPIDDPVCSEALKRYSLGLIVQHWAKIAEWKHRPLSEVEKILDAIKG